MTHTDPGFQLFECRSPSDLTIRGSYHHAADNAPLAVFCHGFTGQRMGPGYLFVKLSRALATIGISSLRFDFTGSGESEGAFSNMNTGTMLQDLSAVVAEVRTTLAPSKLILCGHSFGGMVAARTAGSFHADGLMLLAPVSDPTGLVRRRKALLEAGPNPSGFYENGPHEMSLSFLDSLQGFDPVAEMADSFRGNLLLLQGDNDLSIALDESRRYVDAAVCKQIPAQYHVISGSDHNFSRVADVTMVITTVVTWTREHFGENNT